MKMSQTWQEMEEDFIYIFGHGQGLLLQIKSFQELRPVFFFVSILTGCYPPGTSAYVKSRILQWVAYTAGLIPYFATIAYCCGLTYYIIFSTPSDPVYLIKLIRRDIIMAFLAIRLGNHLLRSKQTDELFRRWNENMNTTYMAEERKGLVEKKLRSTAKIAGTGLFLRTFMAQLYNVPFMMHRYAFSSELAGFPHDNSSPSHFYYVAFQVILFIWIGAVVPPVEMFVVYLLALAETELELLGNKLASILNTLEITDSDEIIYNGPKGPIPIELKSRQYDQIVNQVEKELGIWTKQHIDTIEWVGDICGYLTLDTTFKYLYLGVHCSLVVIGLTGMGGQGMANDLALTILVTIGNFTVLFYGTRKVDMLKQRATQLALDGYAKGWFLYPISIQKRMQIIIAGSTNSEPTVSVLKIYQDNSEHMKAVISLAYQALTFILPMTAQE